MLKLIFRSLAVIIISIFLTVGLAIWKGGEPFRYFGEGTIVVGQKIKKFGDLVDEFIAGGKNLRKSYNRLKDKITKDDDEKAKRK